MKAIMAIARATVSELRRQRLLAIPLIGLVLSLLLLAGALIVDDGSLGLKRDSAEAAAFSAGIAASIGGALYALIVGSSLIARELSDGTMLMLAARPVSRWQIVLGRLLGAAVFIFGALAAVCLIYGVVASMVSGMWAPVEEPLEALASAVPGVLLALCVGIAFSIQGRATAAIGSAVIVSAFAAGLAVYVDDWRTEEHQRSFLVEDARDELDDNDPVVGRAAAALVRLMPYGVFAAHTASTFEDDHQPYPGDDEFDTIRVGDDRFGPVGMAAPAAAPPPPPGPAGPGVSRPGPTRQPSTSELRSQARECARYSDSASCYFSVRSAWTRSSFPEKPKMYQGWELLFAWLAIPLWVAVAVLLLARRRDLT